MTYKGVQIALCRIGLSPRIYTNPKRKRGKIVCKREKTAIRPALALTAKPLFLRGFTVGCQSESGARTMVEGVPRYETFAKSMEINAMGIMMMTEIFAQHMAERKTGSIINVSSIYGILAPDLYEDTDMKVASQSD